jgi:hypothetical protein
MNNGSEALLNIITIAYIWIVLMYAYHSRG